MYPIPLVASERTETRRSTSRWPEPSLTTQPRSPSRGGSSARHGPSSVIRTTPRRTSDRLPRGPRRRRTVACPTRAAAGVRGLAGRVTIGRTTVGKGDTPTGTAPIASGGTTDLARRSRRQRSARRRSHGRTKQKKPARMIAIVTRTLSNIGAPPSQRDPGRGGLCGASCGASSPVPAIESRIAVSACTFRIR